jgi:hypothetical protein
MKYSAGTVAGLCNQMFCVALLVGAGLLGFPDSQNSEVRESTSLEMSEFCAGGNVAAFSEPT